MNYSSGLQISWLKVSVSRLLYTWHFQVMHGGGTGVVVVSLARGSNDLHMVQLMPLPPHHLLLQ